MITRQLQPPTDMGDYEIRHEEWSPFEGEPFIPMTQAYTKNGAYIGDPERAQHLANEGIKPELRTPDSKTCSIGYCDLQQRWYGWSHRAMAGFAIGDKIGVDMGISPRIIHTIEEAKQAACDFAEYVS